MSILIGAACAAVAPAVLGAASVPARWHEPRRPRRAPHLVGVFNRRSYIHACHAAHQLLDRGHIGGARRQIHALLVWLREESQTGPKRHRAEYVTALADWQLIDVALEAETCPA